MVGGSKVKNAQVVGTEKLVIKTENMGFKKKSPMI